MSLYSVCFLRFGLFHVPLSGGKVKDCLFVILNSLAFHPRTQFALTNSYKKHFLAVLHTCRGLRMSKVIMSRSTCGSVWLAYLSSLIPSSLGRKHQNKAEIAFIRVITRLQLITQQNIHKKMQLNKPFSQESKL